MHVMLKEQPRRGKKRLQPSCYPSAATATAAADGPLSSTCVSTCVHHSSMTSQQRARVRADGDQFGHNDELASLAGLLHRKAEESVAQHGHAQPTSPPTSPVDERLDILGAASFPGIEKRAPPPVAFRPHPARNGDLRDEISHVMKKQAVELTRRYKACPEFNNYMHTMQRDRIGATHRQQVFEWNLELADRDLQLSNQALLLAFNYFDAYLSMIVVPKKGLQLVSTACMWVASKICASECPVAKAEELESLIGIEKRQIVEMERWILSSLSWDVQPVTSYDIVHLLLPFLFCTREHRQKLIQYIENIALAQALVYPLLRYEPAILAVTAIVCGAKLVTGKIDQQLNRGLIGLIGATPDRVLQCRRDVEAYINLQNLVFTNDGACAADRENERRKRLKQRQRPHKQAAVSAQMAVAEEERQHSHD